MIAADQVQLYKLLCRQVAARMDMTACFLPKPVTGVNGNGMHTNMSLSRKGKNLFYDKKGQDGLSKPGWDFIERILTNAHDICLMLELERERVPPARSALRGAEPDQGLGDRSRLDGPHSARQREARRASRCARSRPTPTRTWRSTRSSAPGSRGRRRTQDEAKRTRTRFLPDNIYDAIRLFKASRFATELLGEDVHDKFAELKHAAGRPLPQGAGHAGQELRRSSSTTR